MFKKLLQKSIVKYIIVGVGSLAVDYAVLLALYHGFNVHPAIAGGIGVVAGLIVNFILNKLWSFGAASSTKQSAKQAVMYGALVCFNLVFTSWFITFVLQFGIQPEVSKIITTGIITLWNYALYKAVIFKVREPIV